MHNYMKSWEIKILLDSSISFIFLNFDYTPRPRQPPPSPSYLPSPPLSGISALLSCQRNKENIGTWFEFIAKW